MGTCMTKNNANISNKKDAPAPEIKPKEVNEDNAK